jgi:hypothetical protein
MKAGDAVNLNLKASISTADTELLKSLVGSCRRLGMFSYPNMLAKFKEADIPSFVWVCTEEVKRFIIALYKFCTKLNSSDSGEPPLLSASELDFPLPSNDALWHSIGKHEWEANAKDQNTVSLTDDLQAKWISNFADVLEFLGL